MAIEIYPLIASGIAILFALGLALQVKKLPEGNDKMKEIAAAIREGAKAFLSRQYKTVGVVALVIAIALFFAFDMTASVAFLVGAGASALRL